MRRAKKFSSDFFLFLLRLMRSSNHESLICCGRGAIAAACAAAACIWSDFTRWHFKHRVQKTEMQMCFKRTRSASALEPGGWPPYNQLLCVILNKDFFSILAAWLISRKLTYGSLQVARFLQILYT